ncbi:branched-chain amino acid aminotransferase II [Melanomma pulvis-pyrius CBS 109.77]|uniref:Branched-chain-amino-acid aminotransferase n=1 Tax=Melanomma pulvis-pyrius CBS 109.77 TaxID=1314802 RepID=A0A6A6X231_9PLEO|nr:branched-chain amino acid aminotransferase II [Melanomma pulvis-pyrius CBS 109.77]
MASTSSLPALDASRLSISLTETPFPIPTGKTTTKAHTDHLLIVSWTSTQGWSAPQIVPYRPLSLPPTASVLHYATSCYEGTKLYRGYDGKLRVFRLLDNCRRMKDSATRASMPAPDPNELSKLVKELCRVEGPRWLPSETSKGKFLYIRPTIIGIDADLALHVAKEVLLYVVLVTWPENANSPTAIGDKETLPGFKLWASPEDSVRAWPGGTGNHKVSANYGPALKAHSEAEKNGFDQVLWLHGTDRMVTEAGGSNFFVIWKTKDGVLELVTAPLDSGLILPGITRRSILELARTRFNITSKWELDGRTVLATAVNVEEKDFMIVDLIEASEDGRLLAVFVAGTANFVRPVTEINVHSHSIHIDYDAIPHAALLRKWLADMMYGIEESQWTEVIND